MYEDIELGLINNSNSSSQQSDLNVWDRRNPKVHAGYGASRLPIRPSTGSIVGAGSQYQNIFEGQLGTAAATSDLFGIKSRHDKQVETDRIYEEVLQQTGRLSSNKLKPINLPWNKETKRLYSEHWKQVNPRRGVKSVTRKKPTDIKQGLTLPFSKNIGPGNSIQPATNTADTIAQGHDLHYQEAKTNSDVQSADREAISHFAHEAIQGSDPISRIQAAVGAIGLAIKSGAEKLTGQVLYGKHAT